MSGGVWTEADTKSPRTQPGVYSNIMAEAAQILEPGAGGTVFIVGTADWGPEDTVVSTFSERPSSRGGSVQESFGKTGSLVKLSGQAFRGGAAEVKCLRVAAAAAAKASVSITDGTSAALILTAKYTGTRGNNLTVTVKNHPVPANGKVLEISEGGVLIESHLITSNENDDIAPQINSSSEYVTAASTGTGGRALADVANAALTGGNSGSTLVAADYVAAQGVAANEAFDVYVQGDDTTAANQDAAGTWGTIQRDAGHRFVIVHGGVADESAADARTRAKSFDNRTNIYVHPGFTDEDGVEYSGQEAGARIAGMIAAKGFTRAITYSPVVGATKTNVALSPTNVDLHLEAGVCTLVSDGGAVRVSKGINTLTTTGVGTNTLDTFSKIRTIRTLDAVENGLERGARPYIGEVTNDADGRKSLEGALSAFLDELVSGNAIQEGYTLQVEQGSADQVFLTVGVTPLDSVEQVFTTIFVSA